MVATMRWLRAGGGAAAALALMLAASGVSLAHPHRGEDHGKGAWGDQNHVVGVVTALVFSGTSTSTSTASCPPAREGNPAKCGGPIGTLTVETGTSATAPSFTVLSTTRFTMSGSDVGQSLVGDWVTVQARTIGSATDAVDVTVAPPGAAQQVKVSGTVTAVNGTTSITVDTQNGTITDNLSPSVTVTLGDGQPGTLQDVSGAHVRMTWTVVKGQGEVVSIQVKGSAVRDTTVMGTVNQATATNLSILTRQGTTMTWPWAEKVTVMAGHQQNLTVSDVLPTDRVLVFTQNVGGTVEVVGVRIFNDKHQGGN